MTSKTIFNHKICKEDVVFLIAQKIKSVFSLFLQLWDNFADKINSFLVQKRILIKLGSGGGRGIRTLGTLSRTAH